jgi:hypothetical protein
VLVLVTVLGRLFPVDPSKPLQNVGGRLETVRRYIDIPYDVATYLRIDHGDGVRTRIVARYRALLDELRQQGYDAVVLVAHSQGSALSAATRGDRYRRDPEGATPGATSGVLPRRQTIRPARLTGLMTSAAPCASGRTRGCPTSTRSSGPPPRGRAAAGGADPGW